MPTAPNTVKASVYIPRDLYAEVVALARKDGRPISQYGALAYDSMCGRCRNGAPYLD